MDRAEFGKLVAPVTARISGRDLDDALERDLNEAFPPGGEGFAAIEAACRNAIDAGWMCAEGAPGRRFGRIIEPGPASHGLSVDVVDLENIVGPHHRHPTGEVCMIMPADDTARFDGAAKGWKVYEPGSAHNPTVTGGKALVLYLLPDGQIEFTG